MLPDLLLTLSLGLVWLFLQRRLPRRWPKLPRTHLGDALRHPVTPLAGIALALAATLFLQDAQRFGLATILRDRSGGASIDEHVECFKRQRQWAVRQRFTAEAGGGLCPAKGSYSLNPEGRTSCSVHGGEPAR